MTRLLSPRYGSHLPMLLQALAWTHGPVLELGMGLYSSPLLDAVCNATRRELVSCENDAVICAWGSRFVSANHYVHMIDDWDGAPLEQEWAVALIDHSPDERRELEIRRLANRARLLVLHDANGRDDKHYHYSRIFPLFKYRFDFTALQPHTTVLSNTMDLSDFLGYAGNQRIQPWTS